MNLFLRLLWLAIAGRSRSRVGVLGPCRTPFRVLPTDLDVLRHMNNGVYFSLMDLARVDLLTRAGLAGRIASRGWYPVVVAETIQFRRSLTLFDSFSIETRVLGWDEKAFVLEQRFFRGTESVAAALVRARFLSREGGSVTPGEVLKIRDEVPDPGEMPGYAAEWNEAQTVWRG